MTKRLPVLLYHAVSRHPAQGLTIGQEQLEEQFHWLRKKNYRSWHFSDLLSLDTLPGSRNILITFDDLYASQLELAIPLLEKYRLRATFFAPVKYLGQTDHWNTGELELMSAEQADGLDPALIELAYHSFAHINYRDVPLEEVASDIARAKLRVQEAGLRMSPVMAYPYGKYPRTAPAKGAFMELMRTEGFAFGARIGNRVNRFPFPKPYEVQRLDIKGEYSLSRFKRKVRFGKLI